MHVLRSHRPLARLVVAWLLVAWLGTAVGGWFSPKASELICSGAGVIKLLVQSDDGMQESVVGMQDCPLCTHVGAPPPARQAVLAVPHPLAYALQPIAAAHIAARAAAALPPRGPPWFS